MGQEVQVGDIDLSTTYAQFQIHYSDGAHSQYHVQVACTRYDMSESSFVQCPFWTFQSMFQDPHTKWTPIDFPALAAIAE